MSRKPETAVRAKVRKILESLGWLVTPYPASIAGYRGVADFICCTPNGRYAEVEVKTKDGKVAPIQVHRTTEVCQNHGFFMIAREGALDSFKSQAIVLGR